MPARIEDAEITGGGDRGKEMVGVRGWRGGDGGEGKVLRFSLFVDVTVSLTCHIRKNLVTYAFMHARE